nr:LOW QUALITY PROTEIN: uncharacterized protein LOC123003031 [Drosophila takahashii]
MKLLKGLICVLWGFQLCNTLPTFFDGSQGVNLDKLFGFISDVVNEGIKLHRGYGQQSDNGNYGGDPYWRSTGKNDGRPTVGVSKYEIIDLKIKPKN